MKVLLAPDSFKGSLSSVQVCAALRAGIAAADGAIDVESAPMADGGEGTVEALVEASGGRYVEAEVHDPLDRPVTARYGVLGDDQTAVIEMAAASGLPLLRPAERDPCATSTRGTGELIRHALDSGQRRFIIGVGGSATNDGGAGMAAALGARFLDRRGRCLPPVGGALLDLDCIDASGLDSRVAECEVTVACDVDNPLIGPHGAAAVYGPQKGADAAMVQRLDAALAHYAEVLQKDLGVEVAQTPGAGAAGGLAAGLMAFLRARLQPGVEIVIDALDLPRRVRAADLVLSGEGCVDASTAHGKTVAGVARVTREAGCPLVLVAGALGQGAEVVRDLGVTAIVPIVERPMSEADAFRDAAELVHRAGARIIRLLHAGRLCSPGDSSPDRKV